MKAPYRIIYFLACSWIFLAPGYGCFAQIAAPTKSSDKPPAVEPVAPHTPPATIYEIRIVEKGDTLYKIAQDEETTVKALRALNKLPSSRLQIGQKLKIPFSPKTPPETKPVAPPRTLLADAASVPDAPEILDATVAAGEPDDPGEESLRLRLVNAAREFLGARYRWAGVSVKTGFDCSGLVQRVFSYFDIDLPRSSKEQYKVGEKIDKNNLEAGDLVFFSSGGKQPTHVGIYVGDNQFLHAARKAKGVVISDMSQNWYVRRFLGARRMIELWLDSLGTSEAPETPAPVEP